ncbi:MAG: hypothetical protein A3K19_08395 [Lentisphaerae bacterium RIFOXYB12_FULL_65_16]|nr:MAG: hypothetical protein A3K18_04980 [Lentisphaerae bacterium RIFOXYA12_64_32]OGV84998.1 MAG: hypothetical protein A3K19_08395 [Lentisphaerae bacterium RIFOXYB12_FULL_65_16]
MMSLQDSNILQQFAALVRSACGPAEIRAFGSRARGNADPESDMDVCVVLERLDEAIDRRVMRLAWEVGFQNGIVLSTVTYSRDEFAKGPCAASPLVRTIIREGVAV